MPETASRKQVDKQLTFALYGAAGRMVRMHKALLEPLGLTFPQYLVIVELLDASPRSVGELGARLGMDTGTITPLLKRMEQSGRIVRKRDTQDERRVFVELTAEGTALRDAVSAVPDRIISACRLTDRRADELRDELERLARTTSDAFEDGDSPAAHTPHENTGD